MKEVMSIIGVELIKIGVELEIFVVRLKKRLKKPLMKRLKKLLKWRCLRKKVLRKKMVT